MVRKKDDPSIFEIYENYLNTYTEKYGDRTIVLMQVGAFHELYGVDNQTEKIGQVKEIAEILNILVTRKDKSKLENNRKNHLMAGFPSASLDRNVNLLLEYGYTVVIVDQVTEPPDPKREVTNIYSPGTMVEGQLTGENNYLMSIYFEFESYTQLKNPLLTVGLSAIDLSTGESMIYETYSSKEDINLALDETYRFIQSNNPREIIIYSKSDTLANFGLKEAELKEQLDLHNYSCHFHMNKVPKDYYNISYQNDFLGKIFPNRGILNAIEYLDLERNQLSVISYLLLLQFAYEHNEKIVENLAKPSIWNGDSHLTLTNNTIQQLNLTTNGFLANKPKSTGFKSVFDVIQQTSTSMGRRLLKKRLLNPIIDGKTLNQRYGYITNLTQPIDFDNFKDIEEIINSPKYKYKYEIINKYLSGIWDIERYYRKIILGTLHPMEFSNLDNSFKQIRGIMQLCLNKKEEFPEIINMLDNYALNNHKNKYGLNQPNSEHETQINSENIFETWDLNTNLLRLMNFYDEIINIDDIGKYHLNDINDSFFRVGYNLELDEISYKIRHYMRFFELLAKQLSNLIIKGSDCVSLNYTETYGYYLKLTQNRFKILESKFVEPMILTIDNKEYIIRFTDFTQEKVSPKSTSLNLFSNLIKEHSNNLVQLQKEIKEKATKVYLDFLQKFHTKFGLLISQTINFVSELDVSKSGAKTAIKYNYCQPKIYDYKESNSSFLLCQDLRHPIIERINTQIKYVPHSVSLGQIPPDFIKGEKASDSGSDNGSDSGIDNGSDRDSDGNTNSDSDGDGNTNRDNDGNTNSDGNEELENIPKGKIMQDGMLVYGVNSCGKSSLMKSVGVNLVLAQAGMFVAAKSFIYCPYQYILTRILGNDNLFKGLSSFAVEMSELRGILKRANSRSLVLGDEICHGTETVSAVAIVASAILHLAQRRSSFIFATHLHQLNDIEELQTLDNVKSYHLKIHYDSENEELVYDRNLVPGSGNPIYGLEVAKAMQLDSVFIDKANEIRKKIMDVDPYLLSTKKSRYNSNLYLDKCQICLNPAEHTHHIGFQCTADEKNFIGHYHKNIMANLVPLCQSCHIKVHNSVDGKQFQIQGYKETTNGIKLDYKEIQLIK